MGSKISSGSSVGLLALTALVAMSSACGDDAGVTTDGPVADLGLDTAPDVARDQQTVDLGPDTATEGGGDAPVESGWDGADYPFMCGTMMCDTGDEYCYVGLPAAGGNTQYLCPNLPPDCTGPGTTCECFLRSPDLAARCTCTTDATGGAFTLMCTPR